jgi:GT2 family glycosyltransferase
MIDLTIILVSFETADLLTDCLDSVTAARAAHPELNLEVIVVDNGSRDDSVDRAAASALRPRLVAWVRNRGFAAAVNAGLRLRRGRHVLLLNSDVRVDPDLLVDAVSILDQNPDIGVLGPGLLHPDGRAQRSVHPLPGWQTEWLPEVMLRKLRPGGFSDRRGRRVVDRGLREVEAVRGAVFFVRGQIFEKVGLFDEGYFFFLEETDYCARVRAAGHRVVHCESLHAMHRLGASSKQRSPLATRIEFHRSLYRFLSRWRGPVAMQVARRLRTFRNTLSVLLLTLPALVSGTARGRLAERWGLLLWHFRGCPAEPSLTDALDRSIRR